MGHEKKEYFNEYTKEQKKALTDEAMSYVFFYNLFVGKIKYTMFLIHNYKKNVNNSFYPNSCYFYDQQSFEVVKNLLQHLGRKIVPVRKCFGCIL
jgi:hypothetical protein